MAGKDGKDTNTKETPAANGGRERKRAVGPAAMVAPKPAQPGLRPVEDLAREAGLKPWALAGLRRACGWPEGKQVTPAEFAGSVTRFEKRPLGGGKI